MHSVVVEKDHSNILMVIKNRNNLLRDAIEFLSLEIFKNRLDIYFPSVTEVSRSQGTPVECVRHRAVMFLTLCYAVHPPKGTMHKELKLLS